MFVRLRDLSHFIYCDCHILIDKRNCNIHGAWELIYDDLPISVKENLIRVPRLYNLEKFKIMRSFAYEKKKYHPKLYGLFLNSTTQKNLIHEFFHYIEYFDLFDEYAKFAKQSIIPNLKKWCVANHIPYGM